MYKLYWLRGCLFHSVCKHLDLLFWSVGASLDNLELLLLWLHLRLYKWFLDSKGNPSLHSGLFSASCTVCPHLFNPYFDTMKSFYSPLLSYLTQKALVSSNHQCIRMLLFLFQSYLQGTYSILAICLSQALTTQCTTRNHTCIVLSCH